MSVYPTCCKNLPQSRSLAVKSMKALLEMANVVSETDLETKVSTAAYVNSTVMYVNDSNTVLTSNLTQTDVKADMPSGYSIPHTILASLLVSIIMFVIIFGNLLVVVAIATDKNLKTTQNWFIASLAVADFLLGLVIMPFSLANEMMGYWHFGYVWCDLWKAIDVLLCTASILSICLISLDRYWSITRAVEYSRQRTPTRAALMIAAVWLLSAVICVPPLIGWKNPLPVSDYPLCLLSDDVGYVLYSTMGSFYIPCVIMVFVYIKIFNAARNLARKNIKKKTRPTPTGNGIGKMAANSRDSLKLSIKGEGVSMTCNTCMVTTEISQVNQTPPEGLDFKTKLKNSTEKSKLIVSDSDTDSLMKPRIDSETDNIKTDQLTETDTERNEHIEMAERVKECVHEEVAVENNEQNRNGEDVFIEGSESPSNTPPNTITEANEQDGGHGSMISNSSFGHKQIINMRKLSNSLTTKKRQRPPSSKANKGWRTASLREHERHKRKLAKARERRATIVLGLIMAAFILCWFPFFTLYIITSFCYCIGEMVFAVVFWAGYCNSALNPIIYTVFNRDFRQAFHKIICLRRCH